MKRFHEAQFSPHAGYPSALSEIRAGGKRSHWMWYIFPQLDGLGNSSTARFYALRDLDEAQSYLSDPVLRARYEEIAAAVAEQLAAGVSVEDLMGSATDAHKLVSSLTLFRAVAARIAANGDDDPSFARLAEACDSILQQAALQGYPPCSFTLSQIARSL